jgi:hypothetical protein
LVQILLPYFLTLICYSTLLEDIFMTAQLNSAEKPAFIIEKRQLKNGAIPIGAPIFSDNPILNWKTIPAKRNPDITTWLVCPHLARPEFVYRYYMASGLITIVLGKCFCETCYDMILMRGYPSELIRSSRPMTDQLFQENFINPLLESNYHFTEPLGHIGDDPETLRTWISCSHLATKAGLQKAYAQSGKIFIFEGYVICQNCFDMIPTASLIDLIYGGETMSAVHFQERIINTLYEINYDCLAAIGHFSALNSSQNDM